MFEQMLMVWVWVQLGPTSVPADAAPSIPPKITTVAGMSRFMAPLQIALCYDRNLG